MLTKRTKVLAAMAGTPVVAAGTIGLAGTIGVADTRIAVCEVLQGEAGHCPPRLYHLPHEHVVVATSSVTTMVTSA